MPKCKSYTISTSKLLTNGVSVKTGSRGNTSNESGRNPHISTYHSAHGSMAHLLEVTLQYCHHRVMQKFTRGSVCISHRYGCSASSDQRRHMCQTSQRHIAKQIWYRLSIVCTTDCLGQYHRYVNSLKNHNKTATVSARPQAEIF